MANLYRAAAGMRRLEELALGDSAIHRLHPLAKLLTTAAYIVTVVSFPSRTVSGLAPFLLYPAILMSLAGIPWRPLLARLLAALPFSLMGGIGSLLALRGAAFRLGGFTVTLGMVALVSIMVKTLLTVLAVLILAAATPFTELSRQLTRMGVPKILCLQLAMTYRYISTLLGEAAAMFTAYTLRGPDLRGVRMRDMGCFLGQLILRSFDRAERIYQAMACRGFTGTSPGAPRRRFNRFDALYAAALTALMAVLRVFNLSLLLGGMFIPMGSI
jgi:cobalt/nickel transport system permease protein